MRAVLESDYGGIATNFHSEGDSVTFERVQDCTAIAEYAQARHNEGHTGSKEMKFAGTLPAIFIEKYCNDNGILFSEWCGNPEHARRMLNDPALDHFRIWKGKI
jgi:hypothetical protein